LLSVFCNLFCLDSCVYFEITNFVLFALPLDFTEYLLYVLCFFIHLYLIIRTLVRLTLVYQMQLDLT